MTSRKFAVLTMSLARPLATSFCLTLLMLHGQAYSQSSSSFSGPSSGQSCIATGDSLDSAITAYDQQCTLSRADCDPINGVWYCASFDISLNNQSNLSGLTATLPSITQPSITSTQALLSIIRPAGVAPPPIATPTAGASNGRPICLSDANDAVGRGFGFENNQSCVVVNGITATRNQPLVNQRICAPWFEIAFGNYKLQNNTWNSTAVPTNNWSQCIELTSSRGNYVARWDYNWLQQNQGNEYAVKSYPQVYYGRKTQFNISGTVQETGLPVLIDQMQQIHVEYQYSETGQAERNVALESFFHTSCDANDDNKQYEMMVWVGVPAIRTPGVLLTSVTLSGQDWNVYTNPTLGWSYVAFVADQPSNRGTLDWNAFVDWSRFNGSAFGIPAMADNSCMGAIEIGTETFWGTGTFSLDRFNVINAR